MKQKTNSSKRMRRKGHNSTNERGNLLATLEETKHELSLAQLGFNECTDADLLEFYLFEIDALRARHTYLLRRIKALDTPPTSGAHLTSEPSLGASES